MSQFHSPVGVASFRDLMAVKPGENNEQFVNLVGHPDIQTQRNERSPDMWDLLPGKLLVRQGVAQRLESASAYLRQKKPGWSIVVTYGLRTKEIQTKYFVGALAREAAKLEFVPNPEDLYNAAHMLSAYPLVAGHPTGGAVDVTLLDELGNVVDMGGDIADYDAPLEVFNEKATATQRANRLLLRECMMEAGFTPFDLEWWHFMYGDAEWAFLTNQSSTLYTAKTLEEALAMLK